MEDNKEKNIEALFLDAKAYIDTRIEYTKLSVVEKVAKVLADLITNGAMITCFVLAFILGTITLALYLSEVLGTFTRGFGAVAGIYLILSIIFYFTKDKIIEPLLINMFIRKYFNKVADKDDDDEK